MGKSSPASPRTTARPPVQIPILHGWAQVSCRHCGMQICLVKGDTIPEILCGPCATNLFYGRNS